MSRASSVFICYRRDDSAGHAARLAARLRDELSDERVFFDEASIAEGDQWERAITERIGQAGLVLVVIGRRWADAERQARLAAPADQVRREIAIALGAGKSIVPVLVDGAQMPDPALLPADIRPLTAIQALPLVEAYFDAGVDRILRRLRRPWRRLAIGAVAAVLSGYLIYVLWPSGRSTYVVQVFEAKDGPTIEAVRVRVKSLPSEEEDTQVTDREGLARFQLRAQSILALGLEYQAHGVCQGARLPAFAAPVLPAVTPVYLDTIPARVKGPCGDTGVSNVSGATARSVAAVAAPTSFVGDQGFVRFHLPWGVPKAPLMVARRAYVVGFDPSIKLARWVGFKMRPLEQRPRRNTIYAPDPAIPVGAQASSNVYARNPYDRGNFIRRSAVSAEDEPSVFYLSVIAPQADVVNQGVWLAIEAIEAREADRADVWVLTGPAFVPLAGQAAAIEMLADDVPVPTHWFRIILRRLPGGSLESVAYLVPNTFTVTRKPEDYLTTIAEIERATGLQLLPGLPAADRDRLKGARTPAWPAPTADEPARPGTS